MVSTDDIFAITNNIFASMIDSRVEVAEDPQLQLGHEPITGCIQITGQWTGAVLVQTTNQLATLVAQKMLDVDADSVSITDYQDAMAELTNMIGGNIKSLVPGPSNLSLPSVTTGKDFSIRIAGATTETSLSMMCDGHLLRVLLCRSGC